MKRTGAEDRVGGPQLNWVGVTQVRVGGVDLVVDLGCRSRLFRCLSFPSSDMPGFDPSAVSRSSLVCRSAALGQDRPCQRLLSSILVSECDVLCVVFSCLLMF